MAMNKLILNFHDTFFDKKLGNISNAFFLTHYFTSPLFIDNLHSKNLINIPVLQL